MNDTYDNCFFKKCNDRVEIHYLGKPLCNKHWNQLSEKTPEEVKTMLNIKIKKTLDPNP